jgi:outer membrane protein insertion porin family
MRVEPAIGAVLMLKRFGVFLVALVLGVPLAAEAQQSAGAAPGPAPMFCGQPVPAPRALPPAGSRPIVYQIGPCFDAQGGSSVIEPQTYLYYIHVRPSRPSEGVWVPYDETTEQTILDDFHRLWDTKFLDNLWVEVTDYPFSNGVVGKMVTYHMEERQRVKLVDYVGSKAVETTKIEEKLKEADAVIRLDTFIDPGLIRKAEGIVRDMLSEKGFQFASVTHDIVELPGGPKLVHITFHMDEGPKVKISKITFVGAKALSQGSLRRHMKDTKQRWFLSWITGRGTYQEAKFEDDAERVTRYYHDKAYVSAQVGQPEMKVVGDSRDKKTRWVELRIPVVEGSKYRVGKFGFDGNTVVRTEALRDLFKLKTGDYYNEKRIRDGLQKARELYGAVGYFEFTGYPDLKPSDAPEENAEAGDGAAPNSAKPAAPAPSGTPLVDVSMKMLEGKQYFVNRITFVGNTTTRDNVIRRELRIFEGNVFNTQALEYSVKRLNQLGYFKTLEQGKDVTIDKTPDVEGKVDVKVKLEEQNRNQVTFGAGVSQYEGFFGQTSFTTSNFMGRGESLTLSLEAGSRAQNYQLAFTEPFLFDRNITGGLNVFKSEVRYISEFTQRSTGSVLTFGFPVADFTRLFINYSYQVVRVDQVNTEVLTPVVLASNPFLYDALMIGQGGGRRISKVTPSLVYNTVDNPIFPMSGRRLTASIDLAGLGGDTSFYKPMVEGIWYLKHASRLTLGLRGQFSYIHDFSNNGKTVPITELLFEGGEYSVRGFDIRTIGPQDPTTHLVVGGNKSLLFNAEEQFTIASPARLVFFFDAGQVQAGPQIVAPAAFVPSGESIAAVVKPGKPLRLADFKTSTGVELRFMMPVLNVPFRLIFAYNPQRSGIYDSTLQPQKAFQFRFAVGSTF